MKQTAVWYLGADLLTGTTFYLMQINASEFVLDNTAKVFAALFVGFIGGFMGVLGKRVGEDYLKQRKAKRDGKADKK